MISQFFRRIFSGIGLRLRNRGPEGGLSDAVKIAGLATTGTLGAAGAGLAEAYFKEKGETLLITAVTTIWQ